MATLKPLSDRLIVKAITAEETTPGGILLPDTAKEKPQEGEVIAVGPGKLLDNGKLSAMDVQVGDRVIYSKYGGTEIKVSGEEVVVLRQDDILGVVESNGTGRATGTKTAASKAAPAKSAAAKPAASKTPASRGTGRAAKK